MTLWRVLADLRWLALAHRQRAAIALVGALLLLPAVAYALLSLLLAWTGWTLGRERKDTTAWLNARRVWALTAGTFLALGLGNITLPSWRALWAALAGLGVAALYFEHDRRQTIATAWWSERRLVDAFLRTKVLSVDKDGRRPKLSRRGQPVHDEYGTTVTFALPDGTATDAIRRHDHLAAALGIQARLLEITPTPKRPPNVITMWAGTETERPPVVPAVTSADRTDWTLPVELGRDMRGKPVTFETRSRHSAVVGATGSGKTQTARLIAAHAILDPRIAVDLIDGKGDVRDWSDAHPLCEHVSYGVEPDDLERHAETLRDLARISAGLRDVKDDTPRRLVIVDEWYAIRTAASTDRALSKELDALMGGLLASARSRGIHLLMLVQRGTAEYLPPDQKANILQRVVGRTATTAEARYFIDPLPSTLPADPGEFLVVQDDRHTLAVLPELTHEAFTDLCERALTLRGISTRAVAVSPTQVILDTHPLPLPTFREAVTELLRSGPLTGTQVHDALPRYLVGTTSAVTGKRLAQHPTYFARRHVGKTPVWALTSFGAGAPVVPSAVPSVAVQGALGVPSDREHPAPPARSTTLTPALPSVPTEAAV